MVNAQQWLDKWYPKENRKKITQLYISNEWKLEGELDLSDFVNLKELDCRGNKLTSLNLNNCEQLKEVICSFNLLTNLILPINPTNLKNLDLSNNNFPVQNLSFLTSATNLEELKLGNWYQRRIDEDNYNRFTGSLDYCSGMEKLERLVIDNTDINEVNIEQLPKNLGRIRYSTEYRPNCQLTTIIPQLDEYFGKFGRCLKCWQFNTSSDWCQPCAEQEWKQLTGQKLIDKFIEKQPVNNEYNKLKWIPYEQFTNIEYLSSGGFSEIHKARWEKESKKVALKILNNSQNITLEFLTEITNTKLVSSYLSSIVECYGISQDPQGNYIMVMEYISKGNLRDYCKRNIQELTWRDKLEKLSNIANGLCFIHKQNLIHRDLHSGNILNSWSSSFITDLGLSKPANSQATENEIFGVLPYVAPEILRGKSYTKASDIYSFGIIMYELISGLPPYYNRQHDNDLALEICQGLRPQFQIKVPPLLEDLINRCWDADPKKRPNAEELLSTLNGWHNEIKHKKNTEFTQQIQEVEVCNQSLSREVRYPNYKIHPGAVYHSKAINTQQITQLLEKLNIKEEKTQSQVNIEIPPK